MNVGTISVGIVLAIMAATVLIGIKKGWIK